MNSVIGALRVVLGMDTAAFEKGVKSSRSSLAGFGRDMQGLGKSLSTYVTAPLALAGAAVTAAVSGIAAGVQDTMRNAQVSNADFEQFQRYAYAAKSVGIEGDKLADIFKDVNDRIGDFSQTGAGPMADFFENIAPKIGLTTEAFKGLSGPAALQLYYDSLKKAGASQQEMTFYLEAMASDVTALIPLLENGGEGFRKLGEGASVITDDQASGLKAYNDAMRGLSEAVRGVAIALATSGLIEFATQIALQLTEWISILAQTNPELLKWGTIAGGLAAALGPLVFALGTVVAGIAAIGLPIAAAVAGIALLTAGVVAFWPEIVHLGETIGAFLSGAWAAFEGAWDGMVAKVQAVKDTIRQFASELLDAFKALPAQMLEIGGQIIDGLWNGIKAKWTQVKEGALGLASDLKNTFTGFFNIQSPSRVMEEIGGFISQGLANGIAAGGGQAVASAQDVAGGVNEAFDGIKGVGTELGEGIQSAFSGIGSSIADAIKGTKSWRDVALDAISSIAQSALSSLGGGGGIGGLFSGLLGGLFKFANGGEFKVGGSGAVDSQLVAFRASPNETVSVTKPGQQRSGAGGGGIAEVRVYVDQDANWQAKVEGIAEGKAKRVTQAGIAQYDRNFPTRMNQAMERGT